MKIKKIYLLPNVITAFGLCCGLFAIFKMNMTGIGEASWNVLLFTTGLLMLAAFADVLDGAVARAMKAESEFGGIFDSLADAISFGVAPSVIVLKTFSAEKGTDLSYLLTLAAIVYSICGVLRLVRYNVMSSQAADDQQQVDARKNFTGLPIPAAAAGIVSGNLLLASKEIENLLPMSYETRVWIMFFQLILLGYFMISRWKFPSLKALHIRITSFQQVFLIVAFTVFVIFYGIVQHFTIAFAAIAWGYILIAWTLSLIRLISGKRSKTLEDFEPEPEELDGNE